MVTKAEEAVERVACPTCKRPKGSPCVYVAVPPPSAWMGLKESIAREARMAKSGTPTKVPHQERFNRLWHVTVKRERDARIAATAAAVPSYVHSLHAFDTMEREQMRDWLKHNAHLFRLRRVESP